MSTIYDNRDEDVKNDINQHKAYWMLKKIGHNITKAPFDPNADYLAEFSYPFNTSHGISIKDLNLL